MTGKPTRRPRWLLGGQLALAALVGGGLSAFTGLEIIWIIGGVAGGGLAYRVARRGWPDLSPSARARKLGQILVGAAIGPGLATQRLAAAPEQFAALAIGVLAILAGSLLVARSYAAYGGVDATTAGMATLPGGLGIMPSVAAELGRPAGLVAIVQATRMTLVVVMVLAVLPFGARGGATPTRDLALLPGSTPAWGYAAALLIGAFGAAWAATRLRVPVPTLLGPLCFGCLLALGLRAGGVGAALLAAPHVQEIVGQVLLGVTVGEYLSQGWSGTRPALLGGVAGVLATCLLALALALAMRLIGRWPFLTCLLMVAPGGAPEMVVIAAATDSHLPLV
ncbi:MAG: AbrB family transcriptional regulator, partial [Pseudonocardia sp.]|nr:AbrB family transcriptional regulator [Pseudonocardia sp.]